MNSEKLYKPDDAPEDLNKKLHNLSMKESENIEYKRNIYNKWANSYDNYVSSFSYRAPKQLVNIITPFITKIVSDKLKVLDFGCGTGLPVKKFILIL